MIGEVAFIFMLSYGCYVVLSRGETMLGASLLGLLTGTSLSHDERIDRLTITADRYYNEHKYIPAERAYLRILRLDHRNTHAYNRLGFIYTHLGNAQDALECFKIVAEQRPSASHHHNYAMALFKNREFPGAATQLEKAIAIEKTPARLVSLARIYRILGKYDLQATTLEEAIAMEGESIELLHLLAETHLHNKDLPAAKKVFRRILSIEPDNMRARQVLSKAS